MDYNKSNNLIYNEFNNNLRNHFFKFSKHKFLHNIDTFYYSVTLYNDFDKQSEDTDVKAMRKYFKDMYDESCDFDTCNTIVLPGTDEVLNFRNFSFSGYYKYCIECPEAFDIFIAECVPTAITSQIIVQIRSCSLWLNGVNRAFERSYNVVKALCDKFHFQIQEVKENRIDYCWHTNYIQRPDLFFEPHKFAEMEVSRYKRVTFQYAFKKIDSQIENDYIALGSRGDKCFVRFYLKSKEVIEQGYKGWFLRLWYFNGLINFYDLYVYERLFLCRNWKKLDIYRLQFYTEYGENKFYKLQIKVLCEAETPNYAAIKKLADKLTPDVTLVINCEFQTTRKSTKSYCLREFDRNKKYGVCKRIYDYLDNRRMITDYLTHSTLRLINITTDTNKSRCDYTDFWCRLRNTKQVDVKLSKHQERLVRDYSRKLNKEVIKNRMCNCVVTYSLYCKGLNDDEVENDIIGAMIRLNDNDIEKMRRYKDKKKRLLAREDFENMLDQVDSNYSLVNVDTGEIFYD